MTTEAPSAPAETAPAVATPSPVTTPAAPTAVTASAGFLGGDPPAPATPAATPATIPGEAAPRPALFNGELHEGGKFKEGWSESLKEAGFERLATKGSLFKDEASFLRSLDDALGMVGKKTATGFPTATATEQEVADFRRSAGIPEAPDGYTLKPDKLPEGVSWDDAGASEFAAVLHKHHAVPGLAKDLGEMWAAQQAKNLADGKAGFEARINDLSAESAKVFGKEWGEQVSERQQANSDFVKSQGLNLEDPIVRAALSHPDIVRMVDAARLSLREAPLPGVNAGVFNGSGSPRQQAREIIKANPNFERDPALAKRVTDLYALDAQQQKSKRR